MRFLYSILVLIGNEQRIAENVGFLWGLKGGWKRVGRCLEGVWKGYGRWLEGVWKGYERWLEGGFQEVGRGFSRGLRRMVRGFSEGSTWLLVSSKGWGDCSDFIRLGCSNSWRQWHQERRSPRKMKTESRERWNGGAPYGGGTYAAVAMTTMPLT